VYRIARGAGIVKYAENLDAHIRIANIAPELDSSSMPPET
jgi:hypothetical protein